MKLNIDKLIRRKTGLKKRKYKRLSRKRFKTDKHDPLMPPREDAFAPAPQKMYDKTYHPKLIYRLALLNLSETEMCVPLDIPIVTLKMWKKCYPEFRMAMMRGKEEADAKVARALYKRAIGWKNQEEIVVTRKLRNKKTGRDELKVIKVPVTKQLPPDVQAISMWLKNRHPKKWTTADHSGGGSINPVQFNINLGSLSLDELRTAQRLGYNMQNAKLIAEKSDDSE